MRVERELAAAGPLETILTERPLHAAELAAEAAGHGGRIFVYSGDGTYNEAVNGIDAESEVAVGFLPGGSTSVLPRALGLPRDPVACGPRARAAAGRDASRSGVSTTAGSRSPRASGSTPSWSGVSTARAPARAAGERPRLRRARCSASWRRRRGRFGPAMTVLGRERVAFALVANCDPYSYAGRVAAPRRAGRSFEAGPRPRRSPAAGAVAPSRRWRAGL